LWRSAGIGLHFAAKRVAFCRKTQPNLRQIALYFAAKYRYVLRQNSAAICGKTAG
jgi:hypothetical protein